MVTAFVDKAGKRITPSAWKVYRANDLYCVFGRYKNDRLILIAEWYGAVDAKVASLFWLPFRVVVKNILAGSDAVAAMRGVNLEIEDVDLTKYFKTEKEARMHYENTLLSYTESKEYMDANGSRKFTEAADNQWAPPVPPDPNVPTITEEIANETGSW